MEHEEFTRMVESYEKKEKKSRRRMVGALIVPIALTVVLLFGVYAGYQNYKAKLTHVEAVADSAQTEYTQLAQQKLLDEGWDEKEVQTASPEDIKRSVTAAIEQTKLAESLQDSTIAEAEPTTTSTDHTSDPTVPKVTTPNTISLKGRDPKFTKVVRDSVIVRYYKRSGERDRVSKELTSLGYIVNEKEVPEETASYETNAIFYGSEVSRQKVELVALTFLKAGFPIRYIEPFKEGRDIKVIHFRLFFGNRQRNFRTHGPMRTRR